MSNFHPTKFVGVLEPNSNCFQIFMNENFNQQNLKNNATKLNFAAVLQHILLDRNLVFLRLRYYWNIVVWKTKLKIKRSVRNLQNFRMFKLKFTKITPHPLIFHILFLYYWNIVNTKFNKYKYVLVCVSFVNVAKQCYKINENFAFYLKPWNLFRWS